MVDGRHVLALATSQDHKRLLDGDRGPNTGGMGAYSPAPVLTPALHGKAMREVIQPVVQGMEAMGEPYTGFLYAGLMITPEGKLKVLEFNCRLGDPETQPILMRLKSDLFALTEHAVNGTLDRAEAQWDRRVALGVVMAAGGYPDNPRKGDEITGIPRARRGFPRVSRRHRCAGRESRHQRRARAVRHGAGGHRPRSAAARLRNRRADPIRGQPDAPRHRLSRHRQPNAACSDSCHDGRPGSQGLPRRAAGAHRRPAGATRRHAHFAATPGIGPRAAAG